MSPANSPRAGNRRIPAGTGDGDDEAGVTDPAVPTVTLARLAGIDVRHRQALPLERIWFVGLDVHLAHEIQFLAPYRDKVHLGRAISMGLASHPRLKGMPPQTPGHQGKQDFRDRIGLQSQNFGFLHSLALAGTAKIATRFSPPRL